MTPSQPHPSLPPELPAGQHPELGGGAGGLLTLVVVAGQESGCEREAASAVYRAREQRLGTRAGRVIP